jgi:integrase/recombinase XerD
VAKFSQYFGRSPDRLDMEAVRAYQVQLVTQGISWPALNQPSGSWTVSTSIS